MFQVVLCLFQFSVEIIDVVGEPIEFSVHVHEHEMVRSLGHLTSIKVYSI